MSTHATLDPVEVSVAPGAVATSSLTIRNDSAIVEAYTVQALGPASAWIDFAPAEVTIYPSKQETVTIRFSPPKAGGDPAGRMPFGIMVTPTQDAAGGTVPEGAVTLLPVIDTAAVIEPRVSRGRTAGRMQLAVDNRGNTPAEFAIDAKDLGDLIAFRAEPPSLMVPAGGAAFSELRARPRKRIWRGTPQTHAYVVTLTPATGTPLVLDGTFQQERVIPAALVKALLTTLAVLAALVLAWFTILRPTIDSSATKAAQDQLAEALQNGDVAPGPGPNPTPSPTDGTETPPLGFTTAAMATRLFVETDQTDSDSWTPPDGTTGTLTDLVLENPQGDFGRMTIRVGDEPLLVVGLENFRDLDYHFVTALRVPAGTPVVADVECAQPGRDQFGDGAFATCRIGVLLNGTVVTPPPAG